MFNVMLKNNELISTECHLIVYIQNSTWMNTDFNGFMELYKILSVNIVSSQMTGTCYTCTLLTIHGQDYLGLDTIQYFLKSLEDISHDPTTSTLSLIDTSFRAQGRLQNKINSKDVAIILRNSTLIIDGSMSFNPWPEFEAQNVLIQCSVGKVAQRTLGQSDVTFACNSVCEGESKYSLQSGILVISENVTMKCYDDLILVIQKPGTLEEVFVPTCQPCPLGAKCNSGIQVLPNYWGYITSKPSVSMIRCPDDYCCQGNETCSAIDSCNMGRTGTLCGTCEENLTESIFIPKCLPTESCKSALVTTLFMSAALFYAVILLSFRAIKQKLFSLLKKVKVKCTNKLSCTDNPKTDDDNLKFMQILFYYVQDSKLFTIYLPKIDVETTNVAVKFLEFSPEILAMYIKASELCFAFSSAIIKVTFQLSFGFLVMFFLYFAYLIHVLISHCIQINIHLNDLKVKLIQAFLLTILLSYQKMVMGTFTLVQCVDYSRFESVIHSGKY